MDVRLRPGLYGLILISLISQACQQPVSIPEGEILVASVSDQTLYQSDLEQIIHPDMSTKDSVALANAFIDQWVRDQLITAEAEKTFSSDQEIEQLIADYKGRLLSVRLEEKILEERYDTSIAFSELEAFYEEMQSQFPLSEDIYRCLYVKLDNDHEGLRSFRKSWREEDYKEINSFASAYGISHHQDTTVWLTWGELSLWYPDWSTYRANQLQIQTQKDKEYEYFLKIVDREAKGNISPLGYISNSLKRMILHRRKGEIIENYKQELYEQALDNNIIKIP